MNSFGNDSTVHVWLESDYLVGRCREVMLDLVNRLNLKPDQSVGWIVLNETLLDVSPLGHFDLVEHAHIIRGPMAMRKNPKVSEIFAKIHKSNPKAEFGIGVELPAVAHGSKVDSIPTLGSPFSVSNFIT